MFERALLWQIRNERHPACIPGGDLLSGCWLGASVLQRETTSVNAALELVRQVILLLKMFERVSLDGVARNDPLHCLSVSP